MFFSGGLQSVHMVSNESNNLRNHDCLCHQKVDSPNYTQVKIIAVLITDVCRRYYTANPSFSLLLIKIKEEPIDDEYNQNLPSSISTENIKDEPNMSKVGHTLLFKRSWKTFFYKLHKSCLLEKMRSLLK